MKRPSLRALGLVTAVAATSLTVAVSQSADASGIKLTTSSVTASNGKTFTVTNHLTKQAQQEIAHKSKRVPAGVGR